MARPRGDDWLEEEIANLRSDRVGVLVSLLEKDEIYDHNLDREEQVCLTRKMIYIHFPIADRDVPKQSDNIEQLIDRLVFKLNSGISVVVHCRMGIGRSTIIAAAVLLKYDLKANEIIENITKIRGLKVPDTDKQLAWLVAREEKIGQLKK
jgi:protein-tyrosine phosphatase